MLEKCLNPTCSAKFRTLREGRLFVKEITDGSESNGKRRPNQHAYFWLCGPCSRTLTVVVDQREGVRAIPLPASSSIISEKPP